MLVLYIIFIQFLAQGCTLATRNCKSFVVSCFYVSRKGKVVSRYIKVLFSSDTLLSMKGLIETKRCLFFLQQNADRVLGERRVVHTNCLLGLLTNWRQLSHFLLKGPEKRANSFCS